MTSRRFIRSECGSSLAEYLTILYFDRIALVGSRLEFLRSEIIDVFKVDQVIGLSSLCVIQLPSLSFGVAHFSQRYSPAMIGEYDFPKASAESCDSFSTLLLYCISRAFFRRVAGGLFASLAAFINHPEFFQSLIHDMLVMVYLGGMGSLVGVALSKEATSTPWFWSSYGPWACGAGSSARYFWCCCDLPAPGIMGFKEPAG